MNAGDDSTAIFIDGTDALFALIVRPAPDGDGVIAEQFGAGLSRRSAAQMLRDIADTLDQDEADQHADEQAATNDRDLFPYTDRDD